MTASPLRKHGSIWKFLGQLSKRLDSEQFRVIDHWDSDLYAIGVAAISDLGRLVYVCTFARPPGTYTYECEIPAGHDAAPITTERGLAGSLDEIAAIIRRHLGISSRGTPDDAV
jgi:hypothetical protein